MGCSRMRCLPTSAWPPSRCRLTWKLGMLFDNRPPPTQRCIIFVLGACWLHLQTVGRVRHLLSLLVPSAHVAVFPAGVPAAAPLLVPPPARRLQTVSSVPAPSAQRPPDPWFQAFRVLFLRSCPTSHFKILPLPPNCLSSFRAVVFLSFYLLLIVLVFYVLTLTLSSLDGS